jgi:Predicted transcriptional regulator
MAVVKRKTRGERPTGAATGAVVVKRLNGLTLKMKPAKRRRGKLELLFNMLEAVKDVDAKHGGNGAPKTPVMFTVGTSIAVLQKYFDYAEERGLVERSGTKYRLTGKGETTLSLFSELARLRVKLAEKKVELAELLGVQLDGMSVDEEGKRLSPPPV